MNKLIKKITSGHSAAYMWPILEGTSVESLDYEDVEDMMDAVYRYIGEGMTPNEAVNRATKEKNGKFDKQGDKEIRQIQEVENCSYDEAKDKWIKYRRENNEWRMKDEEYAKELAEEREDYEQNEKPYEDDIEKFTHKKYYARRNKIMNKRLIKADTGDYVKLTQEQISKLRNVAEDTVNTACILYAHECIDVILSPDADSLREYVINYMDENADDFYNLLEDFLNVCVFPDEVDEILDEAMENPNMLAKILKMNNSGYSNTGEVLFEFGKKGLLSIDEVENEMHHVEEENEHRNHLLKYDY